MTFEKSYTLRNENNIMIMQIVGRLAQHIIMDGTGYWTTVKFKGKEEQRCFVVTQDSTVTNSDRYGATRLYVWEGYKLIEELD